MPGLSHSWSTRKQQDCCSGKGAVFGGDMGARSYQKFCHSQKKKKKNKKKNAKCWGQLGLANEHTHTFSITQNPHNYRCLKAILVVNLWYNNLSPINFPCPNLYPELIFRSLLIAFLPLEKGRSSFIFSTDQCNPADGIIFFPHKGKDVKSMLD